MSKWLLVGRGKFASIPEIPGVFSIYVKGKLTYIGQGFNVRSRTIEAVRNLKLTISGDYYIKVSFSKKPLDWLIRKERLVARLSPERNPSYFTHKDLKELSDKGNGYLEPPQQFEADPSTLWMNALRYQGLSNSQIADYLNKAQTKKRWTPKAVHNMLFKYDRMMDKNA